MSARSCEHCGVPLDGRRRNAHYCGGACRAAASRVRRSGAADDLTPVQGQESAQKRTREHSDVLPGLADELAELGLTVDEWLGRSATFWDGVAAVQQRGAVSLEKHAQRVAVYGGRIEGEQYPKVTVAEARAFARATRDKRYVTNRARRRS